MEKEPKKVKVLALGHKLGIVSEEQEILFTVPITATAWEAIQRIVKREHFTITNLNSFHIHHPRP